MFLSQSVGEAAPSGSSTQTLQDIWRRPGKRNGADGHRQGRTGTDGDRQRQDRDSRGQTETGQGQRGTDRDSRGQDRHIWGQTRTDIEAHLITKGSLSQTDLWSWVSWLYLGDIWHWSKWKHHLVFASSSYHCCCYYWIVLKLNFDLDEPRPDYCCLNNKFTVQGLFFLSLIMNTTEQSEVQIL